MNRAPIFNNLGAFTMTTCVIGSMLWARKYAENCKKSITYNNTQNEILDNETQDLTIFSETFLQLWSSTALIGAFYGYLALNVNSYLIEKKYVDIDALIFGYYVVAIGLFADTVTEFTKYLVSLHKQGLI